MVADGRVILAHGRNCCYSVSPGCGFNCFSYRRWVAAFPVSVARVSRIRATKRNDCYSVFPEFCFNIFYYWQGGAHEH